eukprot:4183969-Prymnesium_polylepis.1
MGSVECVSANPAGSLFCSGSWDGTLQIWSAAEKALSAAAPSAARPAKRTKGSKGAPDGDGGETAAAAELQPEAALDGHHDCVSAVCWPTANLIYSASLDGTIR